MTPDEHAETALELTVSCTGPDGAAQVHALLSVAGQIAAFGETLTKALLASSAEHPPVPEQAITAYQAGAVAENADLWTGWAPGFWPVHDKFDPRGFRWADPLAGP